MPYSDNIQLQSRSLSNPLSPKHEEVDAFTEGAWEDRDFVVAARNSVGAALKNLEERYKEKKKFQDYQAPLFCDGAVIDKLNEIAALIDADERMVCREAGIDR